MSVSIAQSSNLVEAFSPGDGNTRVIFVWIKELRAPGSQGKSRTSSSSPTPYRYWCFYLIEFSPRIITLGQLYLNPKLYLIEFSKVGRIVALELCGEANGEILAPPPLPRMGDGDMAGEPGRT